MSIDMQLPPSDVELEEQFITALFYIKKYDLSDFDFLKASDFYSNKTATIFDVVKKMLADNEVIDLASVGSELKKLDESLCFYLLNLNDVQTPVLSLKQAAKRLKQVAVRRDLIHKSHEIISLCRSSKSDEDTIDEAQRLIMSVENAGAQDLFKTADSLVSEAYERIKTYQTEKIFKGFDIGFPNIGRNFNLCGSKLILIAGRPGMGKTALSLSIMLRLAYMGVKSGFLSLEMDNQEVIDRLIGFESGINSLSYYKYQALGREGMEKIESASAAISNLPMVFDDGLSRIEDVKRKARKMKRLGCDVLFIDQLSKIKGDSRKSKFDQYTDHCNEIALLKKELNMPIFLLCQLNRTVEDTSDKIPRMHHLKQTGMLEEDADIVMLLFRPSVYDENADDSEVKIFVPKVRAGVPGVELGVKYNKKIGQYVLGGYINDY